MSSEVTANTKGDVSGPFQGLCLLVPKSAFPVPAFCGPFLVVDDGLPLHAFFARNLRVFFPPPLAVFSHSLIASLAPLLAAVVHILVSFEHLPPELEILIPPDVAVPLLVFSDRLLAGFVLLAPVSFAQVLLPF